MTTNDAQISADQAAHHAVQAGKLAETEAERELALAVEYLAIAVGQIAEGMSAPLSES